MGATKGKPATLKKEKELKAIEIATELLVELHGQALKELEKH
jgi:hypothetical protein